MPVASASGGLTDNNGRSQDDLTCAIGVASGQEEGTGRAFQARDAGSIPVTRSTILPGPGMPPSGPLAYQRRHARGRNHHLVGIVVLGLVPELVGRGFGGHLLTLATRSNSISDVRSGENR